MVVERSRRQCLLCGKAFTGRAFLCPACADRYRGSSVPAKVRQQFYEAIDRVYPEWSNTYGDYNPPRGLLEYADRLPRAWRVLEIGAGGGFTLRALEQMGFRRLVGLDLTRTTLQAMRQRVNAAALVAADGERLPFADQSFDLLISTDVIEHLPSLERHLSEAARVVRPEGLYLIKTPNRLLADPYYRARGLYDAYFWHPSMCSPAELRAALNRHGFVVRFLKVPRLTDAQARKIPLAPLRRLAARLPLGWLPPVARPHLEVVALRRP